MPNSPSPEMISQPVALQNSYEVRYDPIHRWPVIFAPPRAHRPFDFSKRNAAQCGENDPFAQGREDQTTAESFAVRDPGTEPDTPGWQVRIIPNKYPALVSVSDVVPENDACGVHEVIVECPQSETHITKLGISQIELVFQSYRDRLRQLAESRQFVHATIFKNHGPAAGASLLHSHSQLMATAFVPPLIQQELAFTAEHFKKTNRDYFSEYLLAEQTFRERIVEQTDDFLILCPEASRFSFEMHIYPRFKESHFHLTKDTTLKAMAEVMWRSLLRLEKVAADPDYNFVLHTAPFTNRHVPGFRWHWEIYPRTSGIAGWEMGAGSFVNPLFPETASKLLRDAEID